ncbi:hypothetical protein [Croceivirga sp. JEA036]|uniref:hypothetical protein n=1 Tax=Croceivirga sp. JEA036 TaxID=2721162 RepID=UPI001439B3F9|nr:hypothetical protein [Croceivirga sp. JEA036]NJB38127.1 hypothetical protein [Croceivirga sp. JEA036]
MAKKLLIIFIFSLYSCTSEEDKISSIINKSNIYQTHDIFHMKIPGFLIAEYSTYNNEDNYHLVRHIYEENFKRKRMFYVVNLTKKNITLSDSDYQTFFKPVASKMLGKAMTDLSGDIYMNSY